MKLELKHLAPYLPYDLTGKSIRGTVFLLGLNSSMLGRGIETRDMSTWLNDGYKPILRPMSDLLLNQQMWFNLMGNKSKWKSIAAEYENREPYYYEVTAALPVHTYIELLRYHFDVFGLIEQGLAIDINSR